MSDKPLPYEKYDPPTDPWWTGRPARWMRELENHFTQDGNPVHVLKALALARDWEMPLPVWVVNYLFEAAQESMRILDAAKAGDEILKEAELFGRTFGFRKGPGEGSWFQQAALVDRDEAMFCDVIRETDPKLETLGQKYRFVPAQKLHMAYDIVAANWGVDRSTVVRAAMRHLRRSQVKLEEDDEECIQTMQEFVRGILRGKNQGIEELLQETACREHSEDVGGDDE